MHIELAGNVANSDQTYNTHAISVVNKNSKELGFAVNDIVTWVFTPTDDVDIGALGAGDSVELKLIYEDAVGSDIATNALIRHGLLEYV